METLYEPIWKKAGIFEAIKASTYKIIKDPSLILSVAEKWCSETKSFVFSWGEVTITLEDVMVLLGFSVLGSPVFAPLECSEMRASAEKLEKVRRDSVGKAKRVSQVSWTSSFMGRGGQIEHEAFLVLWLSLFVFPGDCCRSISRNVIPIAVRLASGERIALAPTVLAFLYKDLGRICDFARGKCAGKVSLKSLFKLVQVWTWERFKNIRPKAKEIPEGEPRIAQWDSLIQRSKNVRLYFDDFDWRPYTKPLKNWNPLRFYVEEAMWVTVDDSVDDEFASFARCVKVSYLVGKGFVEDYFPHRVARQFGLAQDLPGLVTHRRNLTEKEAWDDYSKSLDGLKLYMPSRLDRGSVTARYQDWWLKSVADFMGSEEMQKESTEAFDARNTFDLFDKDDDDGDIDVSPKVLPLSQVVQKLEEGLPTKRRKSRKHRLPKRYKISESLQMKRARAGDYESSTDKEDDCMTVAQLIRSRKKFSDVEKTGGDASESLGKRSRRYMVVDSDDDSGPCQKHAWIEVEQRSVEDDGTAKKTEITRQTCDAVNGSNAENKTMIDDATKEAESWLHEDKEMKKRCIGKFSSKAKKEEDVDKRLRQRKLAIEKIALELETRIIKMETSLADIRKWETRGNQTKHRFLLS
ncbi:Aminotransferase-like plant mobile domain [Arabidopsis thaliana x Arabidopsis arenosa]|uniref:Aminotransferase-like plant mobile domain n=1 Tax=Arabidopsis thaliana x Arabidopsis arenosa TaxID=1240361 RepID=A0A8T1YXE5_9BRAS|nr:Aminotransferase-like plant mobile domain [Arabidopsis thaliana x Arabidopsis arenosa]